MSNQEFQVYAGYKVIAPIMWLICIMGVLSNIESIWMGVFDKNSIWIYGILFAILIFMNRKIRTRVVIENEGLRIINDGRVKDRLVLWEEMKYCYMYIDSKSNEYIVISKTELEYKKVRRLALFSVKVCGRQAMIIPVRSAAVNLYPLKIAITSKVKLIM